MSKRHFFSDFRTSKTHLEISPSFCPPQTPFFPPRTPKNVKTPPGWRILGEGRQVVGGGSAAGARPRVAKAMLSHHHRTASPDLRAAAPAADPGVYTYVPQLECSRPHFLVRDELRVCCLDNFTGWGVFRSIPYEQYWCTVQVLV